ncbi:non-ribosomal peptide synthetase [Streptomyces antimicrobicus]|uniref:Amino acid adenylation domain-containing protein n=1 Tax=Streptomyces antimicrobicus TaxID=2883108 RepID=A0ABS8B9H2_9ACTN|nr:non-ribosomal peptide synthetase [Streptomyces antimicrobicus]MCB5181244.1 amino acid adenylation domain-containing protein [Streptomyces antimicrobicus]
MNPAPGTLAALFEERVAASPQATALTAGSVTLTFDGLNRLANGLAHELIRRGVGPGDLVGLALPRDVRAVVAPIAVAKAGAAFLPLDPAYPPARLALMVADARPALVVTDPAGGDGRYGGAPAVLALDEEPPPAWAAADAGDPTDAHRVRPLRLGHPAWVIYTSGSTGTPKGVVVPHTGVAGLAEEYRRKTARFTAATGRAPGTRLRLAHTTSMSFDASLQALLLLCAGHELHLLDERTRRDPAEVVRHVERAGIDYLDGTPTYFEALIEDGLLAAAARRPLMCVVGGEEMPQPLWRRLAEAPGVVAHNTYGPTECTVDTSGAEVVPGAQVTIGRPNPGVRYLVLDDRLRPAPQGVTGELYIAGDALADGYLRRPGLTALRFVACPFADGPGARMYRTGDRVSVTPQGTLLFHGRTDDQVKIRGHRIELGEVEAVLRRAPGVAQAVVVVRPDPAGDKQLVAYVVPAAAGGFRADRALAAMREQLPDHLVPKVVTTMEALPAGASGKVDRTALPAPRFPTAAAASADVRDPRRRLLCELFAQVLGRPVVGPDDNFFELGGHSLAAARLAGRIRSALEAAVDVQTLFEAPTVALLAERLADAEPAPAALAPRDRPERVPLSYAQRRLWFLDRFEGASATYNTTVALPLRDDVDPEVLRDALADVVHRHESLRTVFPEHDGEPYQQVLQGPAAVPPLTRVSVPADGLEAAVEAETAEPFDLTRRPPVRARLLEVGDGRRVLLLSVHHIATDGWSDVPLGQDLNTAYLARARGRAPAFAPLPVQYADYTLWQREFLGDPSDGGSRIARQLRYWREALSGLPEELALPYDRPRSATADHRGDRIPVRLDADLHRELAALARANGCTVFMAVQAALAALVHRLGGGDDIPLGSAVAGRDDEALDGLVGFFVNTVVLRTDLSGEPTFRELLARVRGRTLAALAHQDVPFEAVVEAVNPVRSPARHPLFQTMLVFEDVGGDRFEAPALTDRAEAVGTGTAKFDLLFNLAEHVDGAGGYGGVAGSVEFATGLFDRATVEGMVERLERLLRAVVAGPDRRISTIGLISDRELDLLREWNDTAMPVPTASLAAQIEQRVAESPDSLALSDGRTRLTYARMNERANRLARLLVDRGAGPEVRVAVSLPRSVDLVLAYVAILKAGAVYLPIDPEYPADRRAYIVEDARPALALTAADGLLPGVPAVRLDDAGWAAITASYDGADLTADELLGVPGPQDASFVIYTSGSTGRPKGVVVQTQVLVNLLAWGRSTYPGSEGCRVAHFSSLMFDASIHEFLGAFLHGKALLVPTEETRLDPVELARWLDREGATELFAPDLVVNAVCEAADELGLELARLRHVRQAGEALRLTDQVVRFFRERPHVSLHNEYGPSETHVITAAALPADVDGWPATAPIGGPIWNCRVYVLDETLRPVPPGVAGELYLAGANVGRGYLNRPDLTAARFVADPFGPPGTRMYRSGDRARFRADGAVEFLGRVDDQVKIRGVRIELDEIVGVLLGCPAVAQAAVLADRLPSGEQRLVAFVTPSATAPERPTSATLREFAASKLPVYMVPAAYVVLDALPLTANGKLDRRALVLPEVGAEGVPTPPRNARERTLCEVFADVLGVATVGVHDSFFDLGGHSLLAARLVNRVRAVTGLDLTVRDLFESPTVAALGARPVGTRPARPVLRRRTDPALHRTELR